MHACACMHACAHKSMTGDNLKSLSTDFDELHRIISLLLEILIQRSAKMS